MVKKNYKYFIGYFYDGNKVKPLNIMIPKTSAYVKSTLLNDDIAYIQKPDGICSLTLAVDEFSGLFLHPSFFLIIRSRFA